MSSNYDVLVLGATGFTGRLITRYLYAHPQFRSSEFTFAIAARSQSKLDELVQSLSLNSKVKRVQVDVLDEASIERAVKGAKVVINTVGPFWLWGTPVVRMCVRHGVHYTDLTGEPPWIRDIITEFDWAATQTGAIIIPASGMDSMPSDLAVFLSNKALKATSPPGTGLGLSTSAVRLKTGISGGSLSTLLTAIEVIPPRKNKEATADWALSPGRGLPSPPFRLLEKLPFHKPSIFGTFFVMAPVNRANVQRSWGLLQRQAESSPMDTELNQIAYGPRFTYNEFRVTPGPLSAITTGVILVSTMLAISLLKPIRWFIKTFYKPGTGPSETAMKNGSIEVTNISSSAPDPSTSLSPIRVKSVLRGQGDPGYLLTSVMISETALSLLLSYDSLPKLGKKGGVLTPVTACGDVLVKRLEESGRFEFEYGVLKEDESKKTR